MRTKRAMEDAIHGLFLLLGLVTVGCVLLITVYLIISGIPAIREIGLVNFLFGRRWASTAAEPAYGILPFILTSIYGTAGAILIGVPLGIQSQRRESTIGMAIALVTALCYYLVVILMMSLSKNYHVHPEILIWLPPLACGGLACYLIPKNL